MRNTSLLIVVFAAAFAGCLSADPLPNLPVPDASGGKGGSGGSSMMPDADDDAPVSDADPNPCRGCISGACGTEYEVCNGYAACVGTMECIYVDGCFAKPTMLDAQTCVFSCAGKSGIGSPTDPAALPLTPLLQCATPACSKSACGGMLP